MGRPIVSNPQAGPPVVMNSVNSLGSVQQGVAIAEDAWEEIFPAAFVMISLFLQLVLLITGELRKYTSKVRLFAWLAYVGADIFASFLLGLLSRKTHHSGLLGLWSALLIYHLGGPDNFTAYERADSELWIRHRLYLVLQVVTAAYVIAVNTRDFFLIPALLVFVVGVIRYFERNQALKWSSREQLNEEMAPLYEYMEFMQPNSCSNCSPSSDHETMQYFVAGAKEWYQSKRAGSQSRDLVTTADIFEEVLSSKFASPYYHVRACQLCVAFASSFAYLRRIVALSRWELINENSQSRMRRLWFMNEAFFINRLDWLAYIHMERDYLYNWLYAKPLYPDWWLSRLLVRILCSVALFAALVLVIVYPSFTVNHDADKVWGTAQAYSRLKKDVTYIVLAAGFLVEIAYLLRLLVSKRVVVAMLVAVVRTQRRRRSSGSKDTVGIGVSYLRRCYILGLIHFKELWASFILLTCKLSLYSNNFCEKRFMTSQRTGTYLPRSNFFYRFCSTWHWLRLIKLYKPPTSWDQMYRAVLNGSDASFQVQLQGIQAQETPALNRILELIEIMADYKVFKRYLSREEPRKPIHMQDSLDVFVVYYDCNWETTLLIWWIGTLKVMILEGQSKDEKTKIQDEKTTDQTTLECESRYSNVKQAEMTKYSEDMGDHVKDINTRVTREEEELKIVSSPLHSVSGEKPIGSFEDEDVQQSNSARNGELRNRALWLMAYVCRLLTVCPELLPAHLELTKKIVAKELEHISYLVINGTNWMEDIRRRVDNLELPTLILGEHRSKTIIDETIARLMKEGFANVKRNSIDSSSTELAILLVDCMSMEDRWALIEGSAAHFIASLANARRTVEHCAKLTQGGELLTFLWILFSHLGGGSE